ncbi:biopolymer transporter Tol, partial [Microbacterium sp. SD291]|nr:biopolymer transporter Tol [Microbacterium sp. SD291]
MPRMLASGQLSRILTLDVDSGDVHVVHESAEVLYEAPNWSRDGTALYVNGDGHLFRLGLTEAEPPERIELGDFPALNNDHVLDP